MVVSSDYFRTDQKVVEQSRLATMPAFARCVLRWMVWGTAGPTMRLYINDDCKMVSGVRPADATETQQTEHKKSKEAGRQSTSLTGMGPKLIQMDIDGGGVKWGIDGIDADDQLEAHRALFNTQKYTDVYHL